ncbi:MAG: DUF3109 family protein [Bacteroidales bacterium]|jgi:hypothetical protein|nr:DUF3109 family protein [Bacteroidales bacterium]
MIIVGDCIISENIAEKKFCCDLGKCKGCCCIEGDAGAPLEKREISILEKIYPQVKPYMEEKGIAEVEKNGVSALDMNDELCTPLVDGRECVYVCWEDGVAKCAIEKAYLDKKIDFQKPVSCHLYPIRVDNYNDFKAVNYHEWDICECAVKLGNEVGEPLYKYLKEPLIRKFGKQWYEELEWRCEEYLKN